MPLTESSRAAALRALKRERNQKQLWLLLSDDHPILAAIDAAMAELREEQVVPTVPRADWSQAPDWAMWWAVDAVGWAQWYMVEPHCDDSEGACFCPQPVEGVPGEIDSPQWDRRIDIPLGTDWRTTLQRRPA